MSTVIISSIIYQVNSRLGNRRVQMYTGLKLTSGLLTCLIIQVVKSQKPDMLTGCEKGWFGKECKFRCQCAKSAICGREGECPQYGQCSLGYFGPACQYQDLVVTKGAETNEKFFGDGDDSTCNQNLNVDTIVVSLQVPMPFLWIRIVVQNYQIVMNFTMELNNQERCVNERRFNIESTIVDITCDNDKALQSIVLHGPIIHHVCSIMVSGGRNVAVRQLVTQKPDMAGNLNQAKNAVDGNTDNVYEHGSCTLTSGGDVSPKWSLQFLKPHILLRATIYNRNNNMKRLNGFKLETFTSKLKRNNFFLNSDDNDSIATYDVELASLEPTLSVVITAASSYLTMCEVQLFGDAVCPENHYGLDCVHACICNQEEICHPTTGTCARGCPRGKYGFNCSKPCPEACYQDLCTPRDGLCRSCFPGFTGGFCNNSCLPGFYGHECSMNCSVRCKDVCNSQNGACQCEEPYSGLGCKDKECPHGMYGADCSHNCSEYCSQRSCSASTGECTKCNGFREGKFCEDCPAKSFGSYCQKACSVFCVNETCNKETGNCPSCTNGYYGLQCSLSPDLQLSPYWFIAILVPILIIVSLVFAYCYKRKKRFSHDAEDED